MQDELNHLRLENSALRFMNWCISQENKSLRDKFLKEVSKNVIRVNGRFVKVEP